MRELIKSKLLWIAAFGYFVDLYDLVLYGVVRVESLKDLGYQGSEIFSVGTTLLNYQMLGMLAGGFLWGIIGDRRGRKEALFGSIFIYSFATFLNAFVHSFEGYAMLRFLAGFGLAGELGAAVTLVSESLPQKNRGLGSAFIAAVGFLGAALSSWLNQKVSWRHGYELGGLLGAVLLVSRFKVKESAVYLDAKRKAHSKTTEWGSLSFIFSSSKRTRLFIYALVAGIPIWYVAGILSFFAPELARELHVQGEITAGTTIMLGYTGAILGDIACGLLSQKLKSRKKAVFIFMTLGGLLAVFHHVFSEGVSQNFFYTTRFLIGLSNGFFAILIAWIAEMYGTNLRTTMTVLISSLIRSTLIPLTFCFKWLEPHFGLLHASVLMGSVCYSAGLFCMTRLPETFHQKIDFIEN